MKRLAASRFCFGVAARAEKWVVCGVDQQCRECDAWEKLAGAIPAPVVRSIAEAMDRRGEAIIKFLKRADAVEPGDIQLIGKHSLFRPDFRAQGGHEAVHVEAIARQRKLLRRTR